MVLAASSRSKWTACFCVSPLKITQTAGWAQQKTTTDYDDSTTLYSQVRVCVGWGWFMLNKLFSAAGMIFTGLVLHCRLANFVEAEETV